MTEYTKKDKHKYGKPMANDNPLLCIIVTLLEPLVIFCFLPFST